MVAIFDCMSERLKCIGRNGLGFGEFCFDFERV